MSAQLLMTVLFVLVVFTAIIFVLRQFGGGDAAKQRTSRLLNLMGAEQAQALVQAEQEHRSILLSDAEKAGKMLMALPGGGGIYDLIVKAGMKDSVPGFLMATFILFIVVLALTSKMIGILGGIVAAIAAAYLLPKKYLQRKISKRNETFINMFPDAVDMIVRSVRSGHPLNTALRMISENMDPPVSTEFRKVVDEIAFGRSTTDALVRLSKRIDEPDLQFFVVILSVQQETGGNLAEVLSNLSGIIRKRKQLRLRIKAMTSEGRATGYILGALPLVTFGAIQATTPSYLVPLFTETAGNIILATAVGLIALCAFIINNMLQIDI